MATSLLSDAFGHHAWATTRILDACEPLDPAQLATSVPGTFGSILDTLRHLVGADAGYLFALTGGRIPDVDAERMTITDLRAATERHAAAWQELLAAELDAEQDVVRHRDDGTDSHAPLGIRLAQALHHGTDHRSQVCTALTALGVTPPEIDVWDYAWKDRRMWETEAKPASATEMPGSGD